MLRIACVGATLQATAAIAATEIGTPGPYGVTVKAAVHFASPSADTVIQCAPVAKAGHFKGPFPAMLLIHGGAWSAGSNAIGPGYTGSSSSWCSLWASWGFQTFSVGYRLTGTAKWPAQIVDVQAAIRWVRANSAKLNVNGFIGVNGDSAGGQLAMIAGYAASDVKGDISGTNAGRSSHPQLVISQFGPWTFGPPKPSDAPSVRAEDYAAQVLLDRADSRTTLTPPYTVFLQGTYDTTVPACSQSIAAYKFLQKNGRPVAYLAYQGNHEFSGMSTSNWSAAVGSLQLQTIKFGYSVAKQYGALPTSELGPTLITVAGNPLPRC